MIKYKKPILLLGRRGHVLSDTLRILLPNLSFDQGLLIRRLDANIKYLIIDLFLRKKTSNWIICDSFEYYWLGCLVKLFTKKKLALRLRGDVIAEVKESKGIFSPLKNYLTNKYYYYCCNYADEIISVCDYLINRLNAKLVYKAKTIPLGVNTVKKIRVFNKKKAYIITNFSIYKKVSEILIYLKILNFLALKFKIEVNIIGDGKYRTDIENTINLEKQNSPNIKFLGNVTNPFQVIKNPSFFFHFSGLDATPRAILEAMANGFVVFATKNFGIPEMFNNNISGFLIKSPNNFSKLFTLVFNDDVKIAEISSSAKKHIHDYNKHEVVANFWKPYLK